MIEDADGSLLIVDTGGWYKLCCPTSQLHKPDVLGAIYRVKRQGAPQVEDPWGTNLWPRFRDLRFPMPFKQIIALLDDPRPAVQRNTIEYLSSRGSKGADPPCCANWRPKHASPRMRRNAVWTLARFDDPAARALVREFLSDADDDVRQVALHVTSLTRDREAVPRLIELLESASFPNRRAPPRRWDESAIGRLCQRLEGRWPFR